MGGVESDDAFQDMQGLPGVVGKGSLSIQPGHDLPDGPVHAGGLPAQAGPLLLPAVPVLQPHFVPSGQGPSLASIEAQAHGNPRVVRGIHRDHHSALQAHQAPSAGVLKGRTAAVGLPRQIESSRDGFHPPSGHHADGVEQVGADVAEAPAAPLHVDRGQLAQSALADQIAQATIVRMKPPVVVDRQKRSRLPAGPQHLLSLEDAGSQGFFTVDGSDPAAGASDGDFPVHRSVGGHTHQVKGFGGNHLPPVGIGANPVPLFKAGPPPPVAAASRHQLDSRVSRQSPQMGAIQILHLLPQSIAGGLVGRTDKSQTNDSRAVG